MERKMYPTGCLSASCGKIDCTGCEQKPLLDEFKQWVKDHDAKRVDPVWVPNIWEATK